MHKNNQTTFLPAVEHEDFPSLVQSAKPTVARDVSVFKESLREKLHAARAQKVPQPILVPATSASTTLPFLDLIAQAKPAVAHARPAFVMSLRQQVRESYAHKFVERKIGRTIKVPIRTEAQPFLHRLREIFSGFAAIPQTVAASLVLSLSLGSVGIYASNNPSVTARSNLYFIKQSIEQVELAFSFTKTAKIATLLDHSHKRLEEAKILAEQGIVDPSTLDALTSNVNQALFLVPDLTDLSVKQSIIEAIASTSQVNYEGLKAIAGNITDDLSGEIAQQDQAPQDVQIASLAQSIDATAKTSDVVTVAVLVDQVHDTITTTPIVPTPATTATSETPTPPSDETPIAYPTKVETEEIAPLPQKDLYIKIASSKTTLTEGESTNITVVIHDEQWSVLNQERVSLQVNGAGSLSNITVEQDGNYHATYFAPVATLRSGSVTITATVLSALPQVSQSITLQLSERKVIVQPMSVTVRPYETFTLPISIKAVPSTLQLSEGTIIVSLPYNDIEVVSGGTVTAKGIVITDITSPALQLRIKDANISSEKIKVRIDSAQFKDSTGYPVSSSKMTGFITITGGIIEKKPTAEHTKEPSAVPKPQISPNTNKGL